MKQYPTYASFSPHRKAYTQAMFVFFVLTIFDDNTGRVRHASVVVFLIWWAFCVFVEKRRASWESACRRNEERWPPPDPPNPPAGPGSPG